MRAVCVALALWVTAPASAQESTPEEPQAQLDTSIALFVTGAILAPLGNAAVATGSVGLAVDSGPMVPDQVREGWFITILVGLAVWIAGGACLIAATDLYQQARRFLLPNPNTPREGGILPPPGTDLSY